MVEQQSEAHDDPAAPAAGYERLRAAVLCGAADGFRLGCGVLAARGMLAWMSAVDSLAAPAPGSANAEAVFGASAGCPSPGGCDPPGAATFSPPGAEELVAVLAQMTLALA